MVGACQPAASSNPVGFSVDYEQYTLENGLDVVLHIDRSDPIVAVAVTYHVGSARERPGKTGVAHLFEHLLFLDSEHLGPGGIDVLSDKVGGSMNGSTNQDRTNYYHVVPRDALEKVLWAESDRMGYFINTVTEEVVEKEIQVVKNEKRQSYDNRSGGHTYFVIDRNLYPPAHPYHWQVIGSLEDLDTATLTDVREFYDTWYGPNNATLVVAGDFDPAEARTWIKHYFGEIHADSAPGAGSGELDLNRGRLRVEARCPAGSGVGLRAFDAGLVERKRRPSILGDGRLEVLQRQLRRPCGRQGLETMSGMARQYFERFAPARGGTPLGVVPVDDGHHLPAHQHRHRQRMHPERQGCECRLGIPRHPVWTGHDRAHVAGLSPDGSALALEIADGQDSDIWTYELARGTLNPLTTDPALDQGPLWTPDGRQVVFGSQRDAGSVGLYRRNADGTGAAEPLITDDEAQNLVANTWSQEGDRLVVMRRISNQNDLMLLSMEDEPALELLLESEFNETRAAVSPDGDWIAYESRRSGRDDIYVERFPEFGDRQPISTDGGQQPRWSPDGRALFYLGPQANRLMVVAVTTETGLSVGTPETVIEGQFFDFLARSAYDVAPDGRLVLIRRGTDTSENEATPQINVVLNWTQELLERVPIP